MIPDQHRTIVFRAKFGCSNSLTSYECGICQIIPGAWQRSARRDGEAEGV
jgi:hypothetical protein